MEIETIRAEACKIAAVLNHNNVDPIMMIHDADVISKYILTGNVPNMAST